MQLNEEMIRSIEKEINKACSKELSEDFLNNVSGGRNMNDFETSLALDMMLEKSKLYMGGYMSQETYFSFVNAIDNYKKYIDLLPDDSDTVIFSYDRFKNGVFE